jgi:AraC-like DNA-binding protein
MQLQQFSARMPQNWERTPLEEWRERLHSVCGRFHPHTLSDGDLVTGGVSVDNAAGMEVVQVATDVDFVRRGYDDVRLEHCEHMFLLLQLEGECGVEQNGRLNTIRPGDCILVDSATPTTFHFKGKFSNHLSIHLPRQTVLADPGCLIEVARRLDAEDPMSTMLLALTAKMLRTHVADLRAPQLRQLLIQATRQAFAADPSSAAPLSSDRAANRLELAQILIDRNLSEERLSPQWLARKLGVSLRTLQDDFSALGATATSFIRDRRLKLAREMLSEMRAGARTATIAEVAYAAGFNDISYFNRSFKKAFSCQPKDVCRA